MGVERLRDIAQRLVAQGADPETPVALVRWGTTARQETLDGTLATIADLVEKRGNSRRRRSPSSATWCDCATS